VAETPSNPGQPSGDANSRGRPVNANGESAVSITRKDAATGDVKDIQADLLHAIKNAIEAQNKTLNMAFPTGGTGGDKTPGQTKTDQMVGLLQTIANQGGGDGDKSGGGGGGGGRAAAIAASDEMQFLATTLEKGRFNVTEWHKVFGKGIAVQFRQNLETLTQSVFRAGSDFADMSGAIRKTVSTIEDIAKVGQGGLIGVSSLVEDLGAAARENRDTLASTLPTLMSFAEDGTMLIGTMGNSLKEVATTLKANRDAFEKVAPDMLDQLNEQETNEILIRMLAMQRRAGVMGTNKDILEAKSTQDQLQVLKDISFSTGKQLTELLKAKEQRQQSIQEMVFNGKMTQEQANNFTEMSTHLTKMGLDKAVKWLEMINQKGGSQAYGSTPEGSRVLGVGDNRAILERLEFLTEEQAATPETSEEVARLIAKFTGQQARMLNQHGAAIIHSAEAAELFAVRQEAADYVDPQSEMNKERKAAAKVKGEKPVLVGAAEIRKKQLEHEKSLNDKLVAAYQQSAEVIRQNLGAGGALFGAILANTAALIFNSGVLGFLKKFANGPGALDMKSFMGKKSLNKADELLKNSPLGDAKLQSKGGGRMGRMAGMAGKAATATGALISAASAAIIGVAIAGAVGAAVGTLFSEGVEWFTGGKTSVGTWFHDTFAGPDDSDTAKRAKKESNKLLAASMARKHGLAPPIAPTKGVSPQSPGDSAAVAPAELAQGPQMMVLTSEASATELGKQSESLLQIIMLLTTANSQRFDMIGKIGASGSTTGKHSTPGQTINRNKPPAMWSPLLQEGGPATPDAYT
jgi:hypothetical protein